MLFWYLLMSGCVITLWLAFYAILRYKWPSTRAGRVATVLV